MSTNQQNFAYPADVVTVPISAATTIKQGDLIKIASNLGTPVAAKGDSIHGVALEANPTASLGDTVTLIAVQRPSKNVFFFFLKSGDVVSYDDAVYLCDSATLPQQVTTTNSSSTIVGRVRDVGPITGASDGTTRVRVEMGVA